MLCLSTKLLGWLIHLLFKASVSYFQYLTLLFKASASFFHYSLVIYCELVTFFSEGMNANEVLRAQFSSGVSSTLEDTDVASKILLCSIDRTLSSC